MRTLLLVRRRNFRYFRNYLPALLIDLVGELVFVPLRMSHFLWRLMQRGRPKIPRKILIVKLDHIGDVLLTTPAIRAIRERYPDARITCLVGSWAVPVLRGNPDVDQVLAANMRWYSRRVPDSQRKVAGMIRSLRKDRFDLCFVFRPNLHDIAFGFFTGARERAGIGGKGGHFFLTRPAAFTPGLPIIRQHERVLKAAGVDAAPPPRPIFNLRPEHAERADRLLREITDGRVSLLAGICPEGGLPIKRWRSAAWRETALTLIEKYDAGIVFLGDLGAGKITNKITPDLPAERVVDLTGRTTLEEMAAVTARLDLLLTVDTAQRHFAAAFAVPTVVVQWAAMDSGEWSSYTAEQVIVRETLDCDACGRTRCKYPNVPCMEKITPSRVLEEAARLIKKSR